MKKTLLSIAAIALISLGVEAQQDYHFSQFFASPITYNPANSGAFESDVRAAINYRSQYGSISEPFKTFAFAADAPIKLTKKAYDRNFLGVGLFATNDNTGDIEFNNFHIAGNVAYAIDLGGTNENPHFVSLGLQFGYMQRSQNFASATWERQWDGTGFDTGVANGEQHAGKVTESNFDFGGGMSWFYSINDRSRVLVGAAVLHANRPQVNLLGNDEALMTKATGHISAAIRPADSEVTYLPNIFVMFQGPNRIIDVGSEIEFSLWDRTQSTRFKNNLSTNLGAYYRVQDAIYFIGRVNYHDFSFGLSYDFTISKLAANNNGRGGVEIVLTYQKAFSGPGNNRQKLYKSKGL